MSWLKRRGEADSAKLYAHMLKCCYSILTIFMIFSTLAATRRDQSHMLACYAIEVLQDRLLAVEDGLHPTSQGVGECSSPLPIVMVGDMPEMPQVKWNILVVLCD